MLSRIAAVVVPSFGRLTVTSDHASAPAAGSIIVANHTSLADPGIVLAALLRLGVEPVVLATAGLWRIPVLGRLLEHGGHVPVHRHTHRAADALDEAAAALGDGRHVLIYGEGRLPGRTDAAEAPPESFRSGLARLAHASGAPVVPLGQAGARRVTSGRCVKQISGLLTAPARRPRLHVGASLHLPPDVEAATARARDAVTSAWRTAAGHLGEPAARVAAATRAA
ncbi:1-acyl-sn-glycerol-3-phosphate acyltransferase [Streptomyces sp. WZ.A104]|uniref:lysophospholipid acyltransferase family protein n=1 Tax=Streptomyces sp. WZ.A104 TaxID=2023771 RepID=UPI000BBC4F0F|nr:lysophospholipid acyltransferase family protein [Streptomyces sp. WZ.A104]PCG83028.1 1-acyl-sn-glycerol-3-phosphate acyltransferase [Streptomyces sp. WZ.A104]